MLYIALYLSEECVAILACSRAHAHDGRYSLFRKSPSIQSNKLPNLICKVGIYEERKVESLFHELNLAPWKGNVNVIHVKHIDYDRDRVLVPCEN